MLTSAFTCRHDAQLGQLVHATPKEENTTKRRIYTPLTEVAPVRGHRWATPLSSAYIGSPGLVMVCPLGFLRPPGGRAPMPAGRRDLQMAERIVPAQ